MNPGDLEGVGAMVAEAVENQLKENDPPKARQTLNRLVGAGMPRDEAIRCIASALSVEIFGALQNSEEFNPQRYDSNLDKLPERPWENE